MASDAENSFPPRAAEGTSSDDDGRPFESGIPHEGHIPYPRGDPMKKLISVLALSMMAATAFAQAGTAVKEAGKATSGTAKQGAENTKAATTSEPKSTVHDAK